MHSRFVIRFSRLATWRALNIILPAENGFLSDLSFLISMPPVPPSREVTAAGKSGVGEAGPSSGRREGSSRPEAGFFVFAVRGVADGGVGDGFLAVDMVAFFSEVAVTEYGSSSRFCNGGNSLFSAWYIYGCDRPRRQDGDARTDLDQHNAFVRSFVRSLVSPRMSLTRPGRLRAPPARFCWVRL